MNPRKPHTIEAIIDRIILRDNITDRLTESLRLAIQHGRGAVIVCELSPTQELLKDAQGATSVLGMSNSIARCMPAPAVSWASPNWSHVASALIVRMVLVLSAKGWVCEWNLIRNWFSGASDLSFANGLCKPWQGQPTKALSKFKSAINQWGEKHAVSGKTWSQWSAAAQQELWRGTDPSSLG